MLLPVMGLETLPSLGRSQSAILTSCLHRILNIQSALVGEPMEFIASTKLADFLTPKRSGEPVNAHVVAPAREPAPDFDAMQRVIKGHPDQARKGVEDRGSAQREIPSHD
jgi:hypothetical protein